MRVVIVEDEKRARLVIRRLLSQIEPQTVVVGECSNAADGMRIIQKQLPDLVFVDIRMPEMNGLDMIRQLRQKKIDAEFVIVSGYSEFGYAQTGIELGVVGYILKPLTYEDMEQVVQRVAGKNRNASLESGVRSCLPDIDIHREEEQCTNLTVRRAIRYVSEHMGSPCRLVSVAKELKVSPEHLSRIFHEEMKMTFTDYVKFVKIEYSIVLLRKSDMKVYEISKAIGMDNERYFHTMFKSMMGITPKQYRNYWLSQD